METPQVFESEYRFCQILWENEPINSTRLVKLCAEKLGWSKGTTYTSSRRWCPSAKCSRLRSISWWKRPSADRCLNLSPRSPKGGG